MENQYVLHFIVYRKEHAHRLVNALFCIFFSVVYDVILCMTIENNDTTFVDFFLTLKREAEEMLALYSRRP